ncbi:MAG TPA: xanthine dehydrogenase, partial [Lachnospiraceae bacterium]|nr:xanthine dehydrogenase [Lachnospiraceae bacterium]
MNGFFNALTKCGDDREILTVTVISGAFAGEKAILYGKAPVYFTAEDGFLKKHEAELGTLSGGGREQLCGMEVYTEVTGRRNKMVVCGCGHVAIPVIKLAKLTGFYVTAVDDRREYTEKAKEAGADRVIAKPFGEALRTVDGDCSTYFVIVTRGHSRDMECLLEINGKSRAYVGMLGSKNRALLAREALKEIGAAGLFEELHSPIGLDIGSETPEEIAVSILAEIIRIKNRKKVRVIPEDILKAVLGETEGIAPNEKKILATIISRRGSAPRDTGARMLITKDCTV